MDGRAWWAVVHGVAKSRTPLSDFTFTFHFHALEKEMATHSSVLALRIPEIGGAWWAAVSGVSQRRTQLKQLVSSRSRKIIALTRWTFVGKVTSLLFNMLSRLVITFLPRSKCLLISWLQSPSAVILEPPKIKSNTVSTVSPSISHEVMAS